MVTSFVTSLVSIVTTLVYGNTHPAKRIVTLKAHFSHKTKDIDKKSMACIFIGIVAMIRSLVQRRKKNQVVPGSKDKAPLEHDGKDRGDAKVQLLVISIKVTANDLVAPTACLMAINRLRWPPPVSLFCVY